MARGGQVTIQNLRGKLRLVWSFNGQRYFLSTGLNDSPVNRLVAEGNARQIEADCATGNFDATLSKYTGENSKRDPITVLELFKNFTEWKRKRVQHGRTLEKYIGLQNHLKKHFSNRTAYSINESDAFQFKDYLSDSLAPSTTKERIGLLKACWNWAIDQSILEKNVWADVRVRVPPKPKPKPLTQDEVKKILNVFEQSPYCSHYLGYVQFLLGTGMRTGEVIGLKWEYVSENCSQIWVGEMLSRGTRKETKNNQARTLNLPPNLQELLRAMKPDDAKGLVFLAPDGGPISDHNFRNRAWKKCLKDAGVEYRKPYITRSTFISHCLAMGMNPVDVSELTGHDVETLYKEYAGSIKSSPKVPKMEW